MDFRLSNGNQKQRPIDWNSYWMQAMPVYDQWSLSQQQLLEQQMYHTRPYFAPQAFPSPPPTQCNASSPSLSVASSQQESRQLYPTKPEFQPQMVVHERVPKDKVTRRKDQNRASQRACRDRQQKRIEELQQEISELKASCWELEQRNQKFTKDLEFRWQKVLLELKCELEGSAMDAAHQEAIGWMLKHGYGTDGADDTRFSVFPVNEGPGKSDCTLC